MLDSETVLRLFEIIYSRNQDKSMLFIQEELYNACCAIIKTEERLNACEEAEAKPSEEKKKSFTVKDMAIKDPKKIRESISEDSITCCICGQSFQSLGAHLRRTHGVSAKEYCGLCGLSEDTVLMSKSYYRKAQQYAMRAFKSLPRNRRRDDDEDFNEAEFKEIGFDDVEDLPADIERLPDEE